MQVSDRIQHFKEADSLFIKELFDLDKKANNDLNLEDLDGRPCKHCGKVPEIVVVGHYIRHGITYSRYDRSQRVDCEELQENGTNRLVTYHIDCWFKTILALPE